MMVKIKDEGLRRALNYNGLAVDGDAVAEEELIQLEFIDWSEEGAGEGAPEVFERIENLEGLEKATNLKELDVSGNRITSLAPIAGRSAMEILRLSHNDLSDVSGIAGMESLRVASLDSNPRLSDISALAEAASLAFVDISHTDVTDFTPLLGLEKLREVRLLGLDVSEEDESFETLVELGLRGVKLELVGLGSLKADLQAALGAEIGRRKLVDVPGDDEVRDAFVEAGLEELAARWVEDGPTGTRKKGNSILHAIVLAEVDTEERAALTRLVVAAGADVNLAQTEVPFTSPLGLAARYVRDPEYLRVLHELGADPNWPTKAPPLAEAVTAYDEEKRPALIDAMLEMGAKPGRGGAFVAICEEGSLDLVEQAVESAEDLDVLHDGKSGLHRATRKGREDVVNLLLEAGADPNVGDSFGTPPIHVARTVGTFDALVNAGAVLDTEGETVLFDYVRLGEKAPDAAAGLVRRAVEAGVDVNARNREGRTALHALAATRASAGKRDANVASLVPLLVELGARVTALSKEGHSAYDLALGDELKKALKSVECATGKTTIKRLSKKLTSLDTDDETAWNAALELSGAGQDEALAEVAEVLAAKLKEHELAAPMSVFKPTSSPVIALLAGGVDGTDAYGTPLTHLLFEEGEHHIEGGAAAREPALRALLAAGADPHSIDGQGHSLLRRYLGRIKPWDVELVEQLVGPSTINAPRVPSPLQTAANALASDYGTISEEVADQMLDLLVEAGADLTVHSTVSALCRAGRLELVKKAVQAGADIHALDGSDSLLSDAVRADAVDIVEYLLELGVDANIGKRTPLFAVRSVDTLDLLLDHGADPLVRAPHGEGTPLHTIAGQWEVDAESMVAIFERFENLGVARDTPNKYGQTPLESLTHREEPAIQALLD